MYKPGVVVPVVVVVVVVLTLTRITGMYYWRFVYRTKLESKEKLERFRKLSYGSWSSERPGMGNP